MKLNLDRETNVCGCNPPTRQVRRTETQNMKREFDSGPHMELKESYLLVHDKEKRKAPWLNPA
jgi:hypothetical protein